MVPQDLSSEDDNLFSVADDDILLSDFFVLLWLVVIAVVADGVAVDDVDEPSVVVLLWSFVAFV